MKLFLNVSSMLDTNGKLNINCRKRGRKSLLRGKLNSRFTVKEVECMPSKQAIMATSTKLSLWLKGNHDIVDHTLFQKIVQYEGDILAVKYRGGITGDKIKHVAVVAGVKCDGLASDEKSLFVNVLLV